MILQEVEHVMAAKSHPVKDLQAVSSVTLLGVLPHAKRQNSGRLEASCGLNSFVHGHLRTNRGRDLPGVTQLPGCITLKPSTPRSVPKPFVFKHLHRPLEELLPGAPQLASCGALEAGSRRYG